MSKFLVRLNVKRLCLPARFAGSTFVAGATSAEEAASARREDRFASSVNSDVSSEFLRGRQILVQKLFRNPAQYCPNGQYYPACNQIRYG